MQARFCTYAHTRTKLLTTTLLMSGILLSGQALAQTALAQTTMPSGGQVIAGTATINGSGNQTVISQSSDKAIINWTDFSIGQGGAVTFNNGDGATLNRVTGGNLSTIDGRLNATGSVYLINPNGVIIGKTGVVNVGGGFVASALDISNANFLNGGDQTFSGPSLASVVNLGKIGALGGDVALMAVNVQNSGEIDAANGTAGLLAGRKIILRDSSVNDGKFLIVTGGSDSSVTNDGAIAAAAAELRAEGGNIYALAGNTSGVIRATGVSEKGGKVWLTAGADGSVDISGGTVAASDGVGNGGVITVTGGLVQVATDATLDASATTANGQGGTVNAIADMATGKLIFAGTALARGGSASGNGGLVETSGAAVDFDGARIDTSAAGGNSGQWLVDPYDLTVGLAAASTISSNLATTNVTLQTTDTTTSGPGVQSVGQGDITLTSDITWSSGNTLTLDAYHGININANVTIAGAGGLVLTTNHGGTGGDYSFATGKSIQYTGSGGSLAIDGNTYTLLYSLSDLAAQNGGSGYYALAKAIDVTGMTYNNYVVSSLGGTFTGLGNTISNLSMITDNSGYYSNIGMIGTISGTVRDLGLVNASLVADYDNIYYYGQYSGLLTGWNTGTIKNVYSTGSITVDDSDNNYYYGGYYGGLVGVNYSGTISNSYSTASLDVNGYAGGLSGYNSGTISQSYATGSVSANSTNAGYYYGYVGGLVGVNPGTITNAYATGAVTGYWVGGLVGQNGGSITNAYATGLVTGLTDINYNGYAGGLVGDTYGSVTNGYYDAETTGMADSNGGSVGLTTAELQSGTLPSGFDSTVWGTSTTLYPYLTAFGVITPDQKISGYAYNADGTGATGASVGVYTGGSLLTGYAATSGANGYYYIIVPGNTADSSTQLGAALTLSGDAAVSGVTYTDAPTLTDGDVTDFNVTSGVFAAYTHDTSMSGLATSMMSTFDLTAIGSLQPETTKIFAASDFTVDTAMSASNALRLQAGGNITIANNGSLTSDAGGDAIIVAADGAFVNEAGANALTATNGRWLVYTQAHGDASSLATGNDFGGLNGRAYYNDAFDFSTGTFASAPNSGNRFVTGHAPTLAVTPDSQSLVYNGTAQTTGYSLSGYLSTADRTADSVTGSVSGLTAGSKNAGTYNLTASGTLVSDENYGFSYGTGTLTITPATLVASLTGTVGKTYDATTDATLTNANYALSGVFGSDNVALNTPASGHYADKNAGTGKTVSVSGLALSGSDAGNYTVNSSASGAIGVIDKATLVAGLTGTVVKTYDATTDATLTSANYTLSGVLGSDEVALNDPASGHYADKNAGSGKTVTVSGLALSGDDAGNYTVNSSASGAVGVINKAALTLAAVTGTKTYDATTTSSGTVTVFGLQGSDTVSGLTQSYDSKNAGSRTLAVNGGYVVNDGNSGGNYTVTTQTASGTIDKAVLIAGLTGTAVKTYDATTDATLTSANYTLSGVLGSDEVALNNPASGHYADRNAGTGKTVSVSGLGLSGSDAGNYTVNTSASGNIGTINKAALTLAATTGTKTYDATTTSSGTVSVTGLQGADTVTGLSQSYDSKNAGSRTLLVNGYTVNDGNGGGNYTVTTQTASGTIGKATLIAGLTGTVGKTYDATTDATLTSANYTLSGVIGADKVTLNNSASAYYADKNAGTGKTVNVSGLSLTGDDAGNYTVNTMATGTIGVIDKRSLTIAADDAGKITGATDPLLTWQVTLGSLAGDDTINGGLVRASGENPGNYAITQGSLAASDNYDVTFTGAKFTITTAAMQNQPVVNPVQSSLTPPPATSSAFTDNTGSDDGASSANGGDAGTSGGNAGAGNPDATDPDTGHNSSSSTTCADGSACTNQPYPGNQTFSSYVSFLSQ